jgi:hypothetical protein
MSRNPGQLLTAWGILLLLAGSASAFPLEAAVGVDAQSWELLGGDGAADVEQITAPLWIHGLPARSLEFWFYAGYASSSLSRRADGDLQSLDGVAFSMDWQPGPPGLHLLGGAGVGVDSPSFDEGDRVLATLLAEPVLDWNVPIHGRGADLRLGALYAAPTLMGTTTWGVLWTRFGSYETGMGSTFDPADEFRISGAYQRRWREVLGRVDVSWSSGGESRLEGRRLFETGGQWEVSIHGEMERGPYQLSGALGTRGYTSADVEPLPGTIQDIESANLWTARLDAGGQWPGWNVRVGTRYISSPDAPTGQNGGYAWRLDAGLTKTVGTWGAVSVDGGPSWGELDSGGKIRGWRARLSLFLRAQGSSTSKGS